MQAEGADLDGVDAPVEDAPAERHQSVQQSVGDEKTAGDMLEAEFGGGEEEEEGGRAENRARDMSERVAAKPTPEVKPEGSSGLGHKSGSKPDLPAAAAASTPNQKHSSSPAQAGQTICLLRCAIPSTDRAHRAARGRT